MTATKEPGRRSVAIETELPGTPEQVWQAVATGAGYAAWFVPAEIEERVGGRIAFDLGGGGVSEGSVTAWQPPHRFAYEERNWSGEAPPLATEVTIAARDGGTCILRMVHSLATESDDWNDELGSMTTGWPAFFVILRVYLAEYAGRPAASARPTAKTKGDRAQAWATMLAKIGLTDPKTGDIARSADPALEGQVIDTRRTKLDTGVTLRLTRPAPGIALFGTYSWGETVHLPVGLYFYGDDASDRAAREQAAWQAWLDRTFG